MLARYLRHVDTDHQSRPDSAQTPTDLSELPALLRPNEAAAALGVRPRDIRTFLKEGRLLAISDDAGKQVIPSEQFVADDGATALIPLGSLRGTIQLLNDQGLDSEEIWSWLSGHDEILEARPIDVLKEGRVHSVRRAVLSQAL